MKAGTLRQRIKIQQRVTGQDSVGQPVEAWGDVAAVWGDIRNQRGLESVRAGELTSTVKASIRVRYRAGITAAMRVLHGATVYQILSVLPDGSSKEYMDLVCEAHGG